MIFPTSKAEYKLIKEIYENYGINISSLLKKTKTSPQAGYKHIKGLLKAGIIKEKIEKYGKKAVLRKFYPNFSETGKAIFTLVEESNKEEFLNRNNELKGPITHFEKEIKNKVECVLIFGSFARKSETKESDIDMLLLAKRNLKKEIEKAAELAFVTINRKLSLRFDKTKEFIKKIKEGDSFALQIKSNHVAVVNASKWVDVIARV